MPKILLMLVMLAGGAWAGRQGALRLTQRYETLKLLYESIQRIQAQIIYTKRPLQEILSALPTSASAPDFALIAAELRRGVSVPKAWEQGVMESIACRRALTPEDQSLILSYGSMLGQGSMETQQRMTKLLLSDMERQTEQAHEACDKKGNLRRALGALGGCAVALLLL